MRSGRGEYSRKAIILNISVEGGQIIRGRRLIAGRLLFKEIRYFHPQALSSFVISIGKVHIFMSHNAAGFLLTRTLYLLLDPD